MMIAYPEIFNGGSFFSGGLPFHGEKYGEFMGVNMMPEGMERENESNRLGDEVLQRIQRMADNGEIGDQRDLKNSAVFIFAGTKDVMVPNMMTQAVRSYFES